MLVGLLGSIYRECQELRHSQRLLHYVSDCYNHDSIIGQVSLKMTNAVELHIELNIHVVFVQETALKQNLNNFNYLFLIFFTNIKNKVVLKKLVIIISILIKNLILNLR